MRFHLSLTLLSLGCVLSTQAQALTLVEAFALAKARDPQFKVAEADLVLNKYDATVAKTTFLPTLNLQRNMAQDAGGAVNQFTIVQPLINMERLKLFEQAEPKNELADALLLTREQELAQRVFSVVASLIVTKEAIISNDIRIDNLEKQRKRAERMFELGQGTITDIRDVEVKYEQAVSNKLTLETNRRTLELNLSRLTAADPSPNDFQLPSHHMMETKLELDALMQRVAASNPNLIAARNQETISKLEAERLKNQLYPTVNLGFTKTWGGPAITDDRASINISMPLDASRVINWDSASVRQQRASEVRRDVEEQTRLQTKQLYETLEIGKENMQVKRLAIDAAEKSVEANKRSADAGVRTTFEVLNSIDILFQARTQYAETTVSVANAYFNLLLLSAYPAEDAIAQTQSFLFRIK